MMTRVARTPAVWRRDDLVLTRRTPRSVLLATSCSEEPQLLEGAAIYVWDELARPATDEQLVDTIARRLAAAPDDVREYVVAARVALSDIAAIVGSDD